MSTTWHDLRTVDLDFLDSAEKTYVCESTLQAPRNAVWNAFADPSTWRHWFPGVENASYGDSVAPFGVGTFRESWVAGQRYQEIMLVWDEPDRWGYTIERASVPVARATKTPALRSGGRVGSSGTKTGACGVVTGGSVSAGGA